MVRSTPRIQMMRSTMAWVNLYGLVTRRVVREHVTRTNDQLASRILRALVRTNRLHRHEFADKNRRLVYFSPEGKPYSRDRLQREFAVLWHCMMSSRRQPLLNERELRRLFGRLAKEFKLTFPRRARVSLARPEEEEAPKLALIQAHPAPDKVDLNQVVGFLDRFVSGRKFRLWWHLAQRDRFILQYLVPSTENAEELQRWLNRRVPISRLGTPAVPVPVEVFEAESLPLRQPT